MPTAVPINDQPIEATFFGEGKWLTEFITPHTLEVEQLHKKLTEGVEDVGDRILACWEWVANEVRYVRFVKARIEIAGKVSAQGDYWQNPSQVIRTKIGNCANKAILLCSLLRNELPPEKVRAVLGNLHQEGDTGGHAWVEVSLNSHSSIMEATRGDMRPMVNTDVAEIYEPVVYFNDKSVSAIEGRTLLTPFAAVYADWLSDYLDFAYIRGMK